MLRLFLYISIVWSKFLIFCDRSTLFGWRPVFFCVTGETFQILFTLKRTKDILHTSHGFKDCAGQWLWMHVVMQVEVRRTTIPMTKSRRGLAMGDQIILCSAYEFCFCCIGQGTISKAKLLFSCSAAFNVSKLLFWVAESMFSFYTVLQHTRVYQPAWGPLVFCPAVILLQTPCRGWPESLFF